MSEYLLTGQNAEGKKVTERVDARSADEALKVFRDRGYEEIVLHTDDAGSLYSRQSAVASTFSPRQFLMFRDLPGPVAAFLLVTLKGYQQGWYAHLAALAVLAYRRSHVLPWGRFDTFAVVYLLFPVTWAFFAQFFRGAAGRYNRLVEASAWGRWEEVLARADAVGGGVAPEEIAFRKAQALAGLGRLDEGLRLVEPFGDGVKIPGWMYWSRLWGVYATAKRREDASAAMDKALELAPENATVLIDAAKFEVWRRRNPRRARELIARARSHAISDVLRPFATQVDGLIRLEEGRAHEALPLLEQAYQEALAFRHASPLMGSILDQMHAALALACAAAGDPDAALRHYRLARPRLLALKLDDEIARCEKALGLPRADE